MRYSRRGSRVYILRPYIYQSSHRRGNLTYRLLRWSYPAFRMLFPSLVIRSDDLANAMVEVAVRNRSRRSVGRRKS